MQHMCAFFSSLLPWILCLFLWVFVAFSVPVLHFSVSFVHICGVAGSVINFTFSLRVYYTHCPYVKDLLLLLLLLLNRTPNDVNLKMIAFICGTNQIKNKMKMNTHTQHTKKQTQRNVFHIFDSRSTCLRKPPFQCSPKHFLWHFPISALRTTEHKTHS